VNQGCHEGEKRFVCVCTHYFIFYDPIIFGLSKYFYIFSLSAIDIYNTSHLLLLILRSVSDDGVVGIDDGRI
jgi:hypothetical protein